MHPRFKLYSSINRNCRKDVIVNNKTRKIKVCDCNMWSCSRCRQKKIKEQYSNIKRASLENNLTCFVTLTIGSHDLYDPDESFYIMNYWWNDFLRWYNNRFKPRLKYITFPRSHLDGICHFHVLLPRGFDWEILDAYQVNGGFGFTEVEYVDIQRVSAYLSRYFYGDDWEIFLPKNVRHYNCSRTIKINLPREKGNYSYLKNILVRDRYYGRIPYDRLYDYFYDKWGIPPPIWFFLFTEWSKVS